MRNNFYLHHKMKEDYITKKRAACYLTVARLLKTVSKELLYLTESLPPDDSRVRIHMFGTHSSIVHKPIGQLADISHISIPETKRTRDDIDKKWTYIHAPVARIEIFVRQIRDRLISYFEHLGVFACIILEYSVVALWSRIFRQVISIVILRWVILLRFRIIGKMLLIICSRTFFIRSVR